MLEDRLRATLRAQTGGGPPPAPALADNAIRAARVLVRRRRLGYGLAGCLSLLMFVGFTVTDQVGSSPGSAPRHPFQPSAPAMVLRSAPEPSTSPVPAGSLPLDTVSSGELSTVDGRQIPLPGRSDMTGVYRVPLGWLAVGTASGARRLLWLIRHDGSAVQLVQTLSPAGPAIAPDGTRIAWQASTGAPIRTARLTPQGLGDERQVVATPTTRLLGWFGDYVAFGDSGSAADSQPAGTDRDGAVAVDAGPGSTPAVPNAPGDNPGAGTGPTGGIGHEPTATGGVPAGHATGAPEAVARVDVWNPSDDYRASWAWGISEILGLAPDGISLIALRDDGPDGGACLVMLDPLDGLNGGPVRCVPGVDPSGRFTLSPDGRWLAARTDRRHLVVFSTDIVESSRRAVTPLVELPCDWSDAEIWADAETLLVPEPGGFLRYRAGSPDASPVPLVRTAAPTTLVPRYGM